MAPVKHVLCKLGIHLHNFGMIVAQLGYQNLSAIWIFIWHFNPDTQIPLACNSLHTSKHHSCPNHTSHLWSHKQRELGSCRLVGKLILLACSSLHSSMVHSCPYHTQSLCWSSWMVGKERRLEGRYSRQADKSFPSSIRCCPSRCHRQYLKDQHKWLILVWSMLGDKQIPQACSSPHSSKHRSCQNHISHLKVHRLKEQGSSRL